MQDGSKKLFVRRVAQNAVRPGGAVQSPSIPDSKRTGVIDEKSADGNVGAVPGIARSQGE